MTMVARGLTSAASATGSWINNLSGMSKALLAGGGTFTITGLPTILTAIVAAFGIGDAPLDADLQKAIVDSFMALAIGIGVYVVPNAPNTPTSPPVTVEVEQPTAVTAEVEVKDEFEVVSLATTKETV